MFGGFLIGVAVTIGVFALIALGVVVYAFRQLDEAIRNAIGKPDGWPNSSSS